MNKKRPKKSSVRVLFDLIFSAILFGAIATTIVLLITVGKKEDSKGGNVVVPEVGTENNAQEPEPEITPDEGSNETVPVAPVDVSALIDACEPAIVAVNTYVPYGMDEEAYDEELGLYFKASATGVVIGQNQESLMIVSSYSSVKNISDITVSFLDETEVKGYVKGFSDKEDLAIICVDFEEIESSTMEKIKIATMGSSAKSTPGQMVVSIGFRKDYGQSISVGYISSTDYVPEGLDYKMFRTDIRNEIGGAVVNTKGELIGLSMITIDDRCVLEKGMVLPLDDVKELLLDIVLAEYVEETDDVSGDDLKFNTDGKTTGSFDEE